MRAEPPPGVFLAGSAFVAYLGYPRRITGTPIVGPWGSKPIEAFKDYETHGDGCDTLVSRDEFNDDGVLTVRRVLRRFERVGPVLDLTVSGRVIGTTHEHPFFARGRGWTKAQELRVGDEVRLMGPGWATVEAVSDTGRLATVYNLEIEDDHTYFVGCDEWGFSVWAHNNDGCTATSVKQAILKNGITAEQVAQMPLSQLVRWANAGKTGKLETYFRKRFTLFQESDRRLSQLVGDITQPAKQADVGKSLGRAGRFEDAVAVRDDALGVIKTWTVQEVQDVATVVGGVTRSGKTAVGVKLTGSPTHMGLCGEDIVAKALGGDGSRILMSPAIRPRTGELVPVCRRCQTKYNPEQFLPGTPWQRGGLWDELRSWEAFG